MKLLDSVVIKLIVCHTCFEQHANEDVEKMILGNKCDVEDKRAVSKERGETVSVIIYCRFYLSSNIFLTKRIRLHVNMESDS